MSMSVWWPVRPPTRPLRRASGSKRHALRSPVATCAGSGAGHLALLIADYREPDRSIGRQPMIKVIASIASIASGVPAELRELVTLGRTMTEQAAGVLAYFDRPGSSTGPTEAINGRLEHLRGSALRFRDLTNYIARCLLETGGSKTPTTPATVESQVTTGPPRA